MFAYDNRTLYSKYFVLMKYILNSVNQINYELRVTNLQVIITTVVVVFPCVIRFACFP